MDICFGCSVILSCILLSPINKMSGEAASLPNMTNSTAAGSINAEAGAGLSLHEIVKELTDYAPLSLAESWDNVGLLIEPFTKKSINTIMLTNDLTEHVMNECLEQKTDMIIAYHPPIFSAKKRFANQQWTEKLIACCFENRIAVYSPHTTWDSVPGGVSDWLASAFDCSSVTPLEPYYSHFPPAHVFSIVIQYDPEKNKQLPERLVQIGLNTTFKLDQGNVHEYVGSCKKDKLPAVYEFLKKNKEGVSFEVYNRVPLPEPETGVGRFCQFSKPTTMREAVDRLKVHLGVKYARVAYAIGSGPDTLIHTAAVVPGSGSKVLAGIKADLYVTGEMAHHDILAAVHKNVSVLMTTHSDSERGFLKTFSVELEKRLHSRVKINISLNDKDPIEVV